MLFHKNAWELPEFPIRIAHVLFSRLYIAAGHMYVAHFNLAFTSHLNLSKNGYICVGGSQRVVTTMSSFTYEISAFVYKIIFCSFFNSLQNLYNL